MLEIVSENGVTLDLHPDTEIPMVLLNPMFNKQGSHSQAFDFPVTPINEQAFNYAQRIDNRKNSYPAINIQLRFEAFSISGSLYLKKSTRKTFHTYATFKEGDLISVLSDASLQDVDQGGVIETVNTPAHLMTYLGELANSSYPDDLATCFPVRNEDALNGNMDEEAKDRINAHTINNYETDYSPFTGGDVVNRFGSVSGAHFFSVFPYAIHVLKQVIKYAGYQLEQNPFDKYPELNTLVLFHLEAFKGSYPIHVDLKNFVPDESASDLLFQLQNLFGLVAFANDETRGIRMHYLKDLINSTDYMEGDFPVSKEYEIEQDDCAHYALDFEFGSDGFASSFLKAAPEEVAGTVTHSSLLPGGETEGAFYEVSAEDAYYVYKLDAAAENLEWQLYSKKSVSQTSGGDDLEITSRIAPLLDFVQAKNDYFTTPGFPTLTWKKIRKYLTPRCDEQMNYFSFGHTCGLRFMFYRGFQFCNEYYYDTHTTPGTATYLSSMGNYFPMGSCDVYDHNHTRIADIALRWNTEFGLYETFWKEYIHWYQHVRKPVKRFARLSPLQLKQIQFFRKILIDKQHYFVDQLHFIISNKKISNVEMQLLKA